MSLPREWRPRWLCDVVRLGNKHDGGYVVPVRAVCATDVLVSLGISDDWSFEADFCRSNPRARVIGYDPTITRAFWLKRIVSHAGAVLFRFEVGRAWRVFDWVRYELFFDGRRHQHRKVRIGYDGAQSESLDTVLRAVSEADVFLKIDIEGSEYRILGQIVANLSRLSGVVIEFHDVDLMRGRITKFLQDVQRELILCHLHANNCAGTDEHGDPLAVEVSLVSRKLVLAGECADFVKLPVASLDWPNDARRAEIALTFEDERDDASPRVR